MPQTVYDPLRRKEVALTPEERVRQWLIGVLCAQSGIPAHMMMSEVALTLPSGKPQRADLVVWDRNGAPLLIAECKRPEVKLDRAVTEQALRYNNVLDVSYILVTNGTQTFLFRKREGRFETLSVLPVWEEMQCQP